MPRRASSADLVLDAYDRSAAFYDLATCADDYDRWTGIYVDVLLRHGMTDGRLVDLGCGTGKASLRLAASGFDVTGVDLSPRMLHAARAKPGADRVRFVEGDLRELPANIGPFDVAVTFGEPLNHLEDEAELLAAFRSVAGLLAHTGLFVFDLNTSGCYQRMAQTRHIDEHKEAVLLQRGGVSPRRPGGAVLHVDCFLPDGPGPDGVTRFTRTSVMHSWSYFPPDRVERLLTAAGFVQEAVYGLGRGGLHAGSDESTDRKRLVVARPNSRAAH